MAAERIFFVGDWGHEASADGAAHLPTAECSTAEHAIGRAFAQYVNRRVPIVSVGDTFYSKPARNADPVAWVAARLAAAEECLGPVATRERSWFFVPGNHDEESPLCGASLPQDFSLPEHAAPGQPPAAPGFDWATRYRGRWIEAGPGQAARAMARQDTWWARQLGGEGGGPRVLLIGIDTNCIVNAHVLALAAAQQQAGGGVDERLTKPLRHATAARCGYGSDEQAAVAERQAAWLRATLTELGPRATAVVVVGHHPLAAVPHDKRGKKRHEADAVAAWWARAVDRRHVVHAYVCGHEHNLQVLHRGPQPAEVGGVLNLPRVMVVSGAGGGNDELDAPLPASGTQAPDGTDVRLAYAEACFGFVELVMDDPSRGGVAAVRVHRLRTEAAGGASPWQVAEFSAALDA